MLKLEEANRAIAAAAESRVRSWILRQRPLYDPFGHLVAHP